MSKISDLSVISLNVEIGGLTSGGHTPFAIGAVAIPDYDNLLRNDKQYEITDKNSFYVQLEWGTVVDSNALRINRLDIVNPPGPDGFIFNRSLPANEGLQVFREWLSQHVPTTTELRFTPLCALGMNVASSELAMLRFIWPGPWPFYHRSIDLNSLLFALSQLQKKPFDTIEKEVTQISWAKSEFSEEMKHYALAVAWSNVYIWQECLKRFGRDYEEER